MKINRTQLFAYRLPLCRPLAVRDGSTDYREGFLILMVSDSDAVGWGETAPLAGFSNENIDDALRQLRTFLPSLDQKDLPTNLVQLDGAFGEWLGRYNLFPSVQCGIEMATLNLLAHHKGCQLCQLLTTDPASTVAVNALIDSADDAIAETHQAMRNSYKAVKLKVGRRSVKKDVELVRDVCEALENRATLRLDANRAWNLKQAIEFAESVENCVIEYIEEPLADVQELSSLLSRTDMPVALDESLMNIDPGNLPDIPGIAAIILKPTMLGGFEKAAQFARTANKHMIKVVVSSTFESTVGIAALSQLAAAFGTPGTPVGLDTGRWFKHDVTTERILIDGATISIEQAATAASKLDNSCLSEVKLG
ncbi:MAG: o-succinylbenzoate synthase [Candidatus Zixiibacteriota bacterium]|nr:MAG: o-succinylbenzoate synthase [candidate division Zixibacteria bacterium]